jgi:hypothetical protein
MKRIGIIPVALALAVAMPCLSAQSPAVAPKIDSQLGDLLPKELSTGPIGPPPAVMVTNPTIAPSINPPPPMNNLPAGSFSMTSSFFSQEVVDEAEDFARDQAINAGQQMLGAATGGVAGKAVQVFTLDPLTAALEIGQGASYLAGKTIASAAFQNSLPSFLQSETPGTVLTETLPSILGSTAVGTGVGLVFSTTSTAPSQLDQVFGQDGDYDELAQRDQAAQQAAQQMEQQYQSYISTLTMAEKMNVHAPSASGVNTPQLKAPVQTPIPALKPRPCLGPGSCGVQ